MSRGKRESTNRTILLVIFINTQVAPTILYSKQRFGTILLATNKLLATSIKPFNAGDDQQLPDQVRFFLKRSGI